MNSFGHATEINNSLLNIVQVISRINDHMTQGSVSAMSRLSGVRLTNIIIN